MSHIRKNKKVQTCDMDLRIVVTRALLAAGYERASIRHEITLDSSSSDGRADMVVALDHALIGIEIKSGRDTLDRLDSQRERYGTRFDTLCLVLDARFEPLISSAYDLGFDPVSIAEREDCGALAQRRFRDKHGFGFGGVAPWEPGFTSDLRWRRNRRLCPYAVLSLLWRDEAVRVIGDLGMCCGTRDAALKWGGENATIAQLRPRIAQALRARGLNRWEESFWQRFDAEQVVAA